MQTVIMYIMAAGAILGGVDSILGDRFSLGNKFREGFMLLGPTALSMAGILCLAPALSDLLGRAVVPVYTALGIDPGMFGSILAIDMGGYTMACRLAQDPAIGQYAGVVVSSILGCTLVFTIPVGMGMLDEDARASFSRGILWGVAVMPLPLWLGGVMCGLGAARTLYQLLPVMLLCGIVLFGLWKKQDATLRLFRLFAKGLNALITVGLIIGAAQYMTGLTLIPSLMPIEEAMAVVSSVGVVLLGSLPAAELFTRALKKPLSRLGARLGLGASAMAGFLLSCVSLLPTLALMKGMDRRGQAANAAAAVMSCAALAAHLGYASSQAPDMVAPMLAAKFIGAVIAAAAALFASRRHSDAKA